MVEALIISVFILGYLAIALEHHLKLNKAAAALITSVLCWTIYISQSGSVDTVTEELLHQLGEIASILFFLLGAMTIVEIIDSHNEFDIITQKIKTTSKAKLLLIITALTFFLSALLDNLTTAIVMTSLCTRILNEKEEGILQNRFHSPVFSALNSYQKDAIKGLAEFTLSSLGRICYHPAIM